MSEIDDIMRSQAAVRPRQVDPYPAAGVVTVEMLAGHVSLRHVIRDERQPKTSRPSGNVENLLQLLPR